MMGLTEKNAPRSTRSQDVPTALCISEDPLFLNKLRKSLESSGFIVMISADPDEAVSLAADTHFNVAICDYELSQIDGIELYEKLDRTLGPATTPPVLLVADQLPQKLVNRCVTAGVTGLQSKRASIEKIAGRVVSILRDDSLRSDMESEIRHENLRVGKERLTITVSRKRLLERFNAELNAAIRHKSNISLILLKMDSHASLLHRHGGARLDNVMNQVERIIEGELTSRDYVSRYDEDLFAMVLPDTDSSVAKATGDRLRRLVASTIFGTLDHPIKASFAAAHSYMAQGSRKTVNKMLKEAGAPSGQ